MESGNGEVARLASGIDVHDLRRCPDLKNRMGTFLVTSSCPLIDPIASRDGGRSNLRLAEGSTCSSSCGQNSSLIAQYLQGFSHPSVEDSKT
jgi:hypothetical protein